MTKIHAELEPLPGKYYGTEIKLTNGDGHTETYFRVWINSLGDYTPSERELVGYELRDGKWMRFEEELDEWFAYEISDDHYETDIALKICQRIVDAINETEF